MHALLYKATGVHGLLLCVHAYWAPCSVRACRPKRHDMRPSTISHSRVTGALALHSCCWPLTGWKGTADGHPVLGGRQRCRLAGLLRQRRAGDAARGGRGDRRGARGGAPGAAGRRRRQPRGVPGVRGHRGRRAAPDRGNAGGRRRTEGGRPRCQPARAAGSQPAGTPILPFPLTLQATPRIT